MSRIVVGTTVAPHVMRYPDTWMSWLRNHQEQRAHAATAGYELRHFAAIQVDGRGLEPFGQFIDALQNIGGEYWVYSLDDGRTQVTMTNRWRHITFGQNLVTEYCQSDPHVDWLLFLAADCAAPADIVPRMLEMNHPLCAPYIPTYQLRGAPVPTYPPAWGVEDAMASAACIFINRSIFRHIRWRWDLDGEGNGPMSDDPCFHYDARTLLGVRTYVRHDVEARHYPEAVGDYASRGFDLTVVR